VSAPGPPALRMDANRCPRCDTLSYPGLMGYPRCHRCHEQLRQCRYCAHQTDGLCTAPTEARGALREEEGRPYCAAFESRLTAATPVGRWLRPLDDRSRLGVLAGLVALCVVLVLAVAMRNEALPAQIEPDGATVPVLDGRARADFAVTTDPRRVAALTIRLGAEAARYYVVEGLEPELTPTGDGGPPSWRLRAGAERVLRLRLDLVPRPGTPARVPLVLSLQDAAGGEVAQGQTTLVCPPDAS